MKVRHGWRRIRCLGWGQSEFGDERGDKWPTPRSPANAPGRLQPPAKSGGPGCQRGQRLSARSLTGGSLVFSEWPLGEGRRDELKESLQGVERGRRRERGCRGRGGPSARRMDEADGASRAGRRQAVRTCGPFTLRTSHGLSPPQWATAAKQAKCRQTFGSAWVPYIRPPGAGQFEQGGGRELAGVGARGWTCGQLSLLETAFPGPLRCGDFQNSPTQDGSVRGGGPALGSGCRNVCIGPQKASRSLMPAPCGGRAKTKAIARACLPRNRATRLSLRA